MSTAAACWRKPAPRLLHRAAHHRAQPGNDKISADSQSRLANLRQLQAPAFESVRQQYVGDHTGRMSSYATRFRPIGDMVKLCRGEQLEKAPVAADLMDHQGFPISRDHLFSLLQECTKRKDLLAGRHVYSHIVSNGLDSVAILADHLIRLFVLCGSLEEANRVFFQVSNPSMYTWNAIISGHAELGEDLRALELYDKMQQGSINPNNVTFLCTLKACSGTKVIVPGSLIHAQIIKSGFHSDALIGTTLIDMYAKCGRLGEAHRIFDELQSRNAVTWGVLIAGYNEHGQAFLALELFEMMHREVVSPDKATFLCILKACGSIRVIGKGRMIHNQIIESILVSDRTLENCLIDMYAKCGSLEDAHHVFSKLQKRDVISWGAIISGYAHHGHGHCALQLFKKMQWEGIHPDKVIFLCVLKACGSVGTIDQGRLIHEQITESGFNTNLIIGNTIVDMYAKCGSLEDAHDVFHKLLHRDVVSWGAMIAGYTQHGHGLHALKLFEQMQQEGIKPSKFSFSCTVNACGSIRDLEQGRRMHAHIIRIGLELDMFVGNSLVDMYAKSGSLEDSHRVFKRLPSRDVVSWGAIIGGYAEEGYSFLALRLFEKMQHTAVKPSKVTFSCVLKACSSMEAMNEGRLVHQQFIKSGFELDVVVGSTLVDMYAKGGSLGEAIKVFNNLANPDVVSWGVIIAGYAENENGFSALELFYKMQQEGIRPGKVILLCILKACGSIGAIEQGRRIQEEVLRNGLESDLAVGSALVDMYAKCGSIEDACKVFTDLPNQDVVSWGSMIRGYAQHSNWRMAGQCLETMHVRGLKPDPVTFTNIIGACSHAGFLQEGYHFFKSMKDDHGISPSIVHYKSMVDLLARAGHLIEALDLLRAMPFFPDDITWTSLLTGCRTYGDLELARKCFNEAVLLNPNDASGYVLLSNSYADVHMWEDVDIIQDFRKGAGVLKKPGKAWIEVDDKVHEFVVGGTSHQQADVIYGKMDVISRLIKGIGHVPHFDLVIEGGRVDVSNEHGEKHGLGFEIISTHGSMFKATKKFRVCADLF